MARKYKVALKANQIGEHKKALRYQPNEGHV
jgi:hypothetical protein